MPGQRLSHKIEAAGTREQMGLAGSRYGVVTLHRPSNVDDANVLTELVDALVQVSAGLPLVFSVHPRTRKRLEEFGLARRPASGTVKLVELLDNLPKDSRHVDRPSAEVR